MNKHERLEMEKQAHERYPTDSAMQEAWCRGYANGRAELQFENSKLVEEKSQMIEHGGKLTGDNKRLKDLLKEIIEIDHSFSSGTLSQPRDRDRFEGWIKKVKSEILCQ